MILSRKKSITLAASILILSSGAAQAMFFIHDSFDDLFSLFDRRAAWLLRTSHHVPRVNHSAFQVQSSITRNNNESFLDVKVVVPTKIDEDPQEVSKTSDGLDIKTKENSLSIKQSGNEVIVNATGATQKQPITVRNSTCGKVDFMQAEDLKITTKGNTTQFELRIPIKKIQPVTKTFAFTTPPAPEATAPKDAATPAVEK